MVIFEDNPNSLFCTLFRSAYDEEVSSKFKYAQGNGHIPHIIKSLTKEDELTVIFIDLVPGNEALISSYKDIMRLVLKSEAKIFIMPIPCMEYLILKMLHDLKIDCGIYANGDIEKCVNKEYYYDSKLSALIESDIIEKKRNKAIRKGSYDPNNPVDVFVSFEKYCKYVLRLGVIDCISTSSEDNYGIKNERYGWFYTKDCRCCKPMDMCIHYTLQDKSRALLSQYPCIPNGSKFDGRVLTYARLIELHKKLVDEFNEWSNRLRDSDTNELRKEKYKTINYCIQSRFINQMV